MKPIKTKRPRSAPLKTGRRTGTALSLRTAAPLLLGDRAPLRPGLQAPAHVIAAAAAKMAPVREELQVPELPEAEEKDLVLTVNPQAALCGQLLLLILPGAREVCERSGVTPARLATLLVKHTEMTEAHATALSLSQDLRDSRRLVGRAIKKLTRRIAAAAERRLSSDAVSEADKAQLRSDLSEVRALTEAHKASIKARGQETRTGNAAADAEIAALQERDHMVRTMMALRAGEPVKKSAIAEAAATYAAISEEEADPDRRKGDR